jgi:uncharacterized damage-inducible protein DinB
MENEMGFIAHQFTELQHGHCWVGLNFKEALANIDAAQAAYAKDVSHNSIWQLVNHLVYWRTVVVNRLNGSSAPPPFPDFGMPDDTTEANWKQTLLDFEAAYHQLRHAILHFKAAQLHQPSPKEDQTYYELLMGCLQHDAYHLGQIVLLRKQGVVVGMK